MNSLNGYGVLNARQEIDMLHYNDDHMSVMAYQIGIGIKCVLAQKDQ